MASLTGVKTLDMANGEITKVAYNGVEYVKVDGHAQSGDLALRHPSINNLDVTAGCFYEVAEAYEDKIRISDDVDDLAARQQSMFSFFRKQGAERVGAFEVGDYIVPLPEADHHYKITNTDMKLAKVVKGYDRRINLEIIAHNDESRIGNVHGAYSVHFRKATPEEVEKYTAPKLKVGDYVRITGNGLGEHGFKIGEIVRVLATHTDLIKGENLDGSKYWYVQASDFVKASSEEVAEAKRAAKWAKLGRKTNEFKQGDIVRIISAGLSGLRNGELGIVGEIDGDILRVCGRLSYATLINADNVEIVAPAESRVDVE